jgi:hypothetical protein
MDILGEHYDRSVLFEDRMFDLGTFEELQAKIDS